MSGFPPEGLLADGLPADGLPAVGLLLGVPPSLTVLHAATETTIARVSRIEIKRTLFFILFLLNLYFLLLLRGCRKI